MMVSLSDILTGKVKIPKGLLDDLICQAEEGVLMPQEILGQIYQEGLTIGKNIRKAVYYYEMAEKQNSFFALRQLADIYAEGEGVIPVNDEKYVYYLTRLDGLGDDYAPYLLGLYYQEDKNDAQKALKYFRKSARLGVAEAKLAFAQLMEKKMEFPCSPQDEIPIKPKVLKYYQEAALEIPSDAALVALGEIYLYGRKNVKLDIELALRCYEFAVCLGDKSVEGLYEYLKDNIEKFRECLPQRFSNGNQAFKKALEERLVQYKKMQAIAHYKKNTCF